jgi:hypothetical protein
MILTEYTPGVAERRPTDAVHTYPASLLQLAAAGYSIWHLVGVSKGSFEPRKADWANALLPPLRTVTKVRGVLEGCSVTPTVPCTAPAPPLPRLTTPSPAPFRLPRQTSLAAEAKNAHNMLRDRTSDIFAIPWDLHPRSLHAEFSHNTDLLLSLDPAAVPSDRPVGIWHDSPYGLGGGLCAHVQRDGTADELIGRLCVREGRNESIAAAVAAADAPRPLSKGQHRHDAVRAEAAEWVLTGPERSWGRVMTRRGMQTTAERPGGAGAIRGGGAASAGAAGVRGL